MNKESINKVQDYPHLSKDSSNEAVLNTDTQALMAYKKRRSQMRQIEKVTTEMESLKADMADIKNSLQLIVKGLK